MNNVILPSSLYKILILFTVLILIRGDKFIGKYLYSKVKNHLASTSNGTNHKLWMEYLEKKLEKISMFASIQQFKKRQIFSVVQYYKRNVQRKLLKKVQSLCTKQYTELQTDIVGSICGSAKDAIIVDPTDVTCGHVKDTFYLFGVCIVDLVKRLFISECKIHTLYHNTICHY